MKITRVYLVYFRDRFSSQLKGVFSTNKKAKQFIDKAYLPWGVKNDWFIRIEKVK